MVKIKISTANEAFNEPGTGPEIARILKRLAKDVESGVVHNDELRLRDINGNTVGSFKYTNK